MDEDLRDCLERPNPYTEYRIEVSQPDVGQVLRRPDQFLKLVSDGGNLVSMSPAGSLSASPFGGLQLTPSLEALAQFPGTQSSFSLNAADTQDRRMKGASWRMNDLGFVSATIQSVQAKVKAEPWPGGFFFSQKFECQFYQIIETPGANVSNPGSPNYQATSVVRYTFAPLLTPAPVVEISRDAWVSNQVQPLIFQLTNRPLTIDRIPQFARGSGGILPKILIVVRMVAPIPGGTDHYKWLTDTGTAHSLANVGTFERAFWAKDNPNDEWSEQVFTDVPNITLNIETYPATGQAIYLIDLGRIPRADSVGRFDFQRQLPSGVSALFEYSTVGAGGPWTVAKHGDPVPAAQQFYWLRVTLTSNT